MNSKVVEMYGKWNARNEKFHRKETEQNQFKTFICNKIFIDIAQYFHETFPRLKLYETLIFFPAKYIFIQFQLDQTIVTQFQHQTI